MCPGPGLSSGPVWDPEQLAEIPVLVDRLQATGDPLGEWLAIRVRLDAPGEIASVERRALRRRARALREQLGPRLILADNPRLGRPHAIRELGLLVDVSFAEASTERLAELFVRPDAPLLLRLRLRGDAATLGGCVELLREPPSRAGAAIQASLRELALELDAERRTEPRADLVARAAQLGERLPSLFSLSVDARVLSLGFVEDALDKPEPWSPSRRTTLGRALASPSAAHRRKALERLREHGAVANQLRSALLRIIETDPEPRVRLAAFAVVARLGSGAAAMLALLVDAARERDDPELHDWLTRMPAAAPTTGSAAKPNDES